MPPLGMRTLIQRLLAAAVILLVGSGLLVGQSKRAEVFLTTKRAEQGNANAQFNLGLIYDNGRGVPQDFAEAAKWYRLAAEQGQADAQCNLGVMYSEGQGVAQDYAEAVKWYRQAAEQGQAGAQFNLGGSYREGEGVPQDYAEAVKWYRLAAEQGYAGGQYNLGVMYNNGQGVAQDYAEAHKWVNLAAAQSQGDEQKKFSEARDLIAEKMTPQQIAEAQRLAREWKPKTWDELKGQLQD